MIEIMLASIFKKINEPGLEINPEMFEKLVPSDRGVTYWFGYSVAISVDGSTVVIGSCRDSRKANQAGSAYIFKKQADGSYLETQKLLASDGAASDYFGWSVAVSADGSTVVVGAYKDDDKGDDSGSAYVFTKQPDGSYLETHKLLASDGAAGNYFGHSVAISNTSVVIGAHHESSQGAVYVF